MVLSEERLAEIRARYDAVYEDLDPQHGARWDEMAVEELEHIGELLAEVDHLRAELATAQEIVRAVADADNSDESVCWQICQMRGLPSGGDDLDWVSEHTAPCVVEQARALFTPMESEAE